MLLSFGRRPALVEHAVGEFLLPLRLVKYPALGFPVRPKLASSCGVYPGAGPSIIRPHSAANRWKSTVGAQLALIGNFPHGFSSSWSSQVSAVIPVHLVKFRPLPIERGVYLLDLLLPLLLVTLFDTHL